MTEPRDAVHVVLTTAPSVEVGERIARALVEDRWAACVNIVPAVTSIYRWEGEIRTDTEVLLIVKTGVIAYEGLEARIVELHPYDVPEVLKLPAVGGSDDYLRWVAGEVRGP